MAVEGREALGEASVRSSLMLGRANAGRLPEGAQQQQQQCLGYFIAEKGKALLLRRNLQTLE